ncbi:GRANULINS domain-containing protein [Trichonephila inaurata madagascariensis]|uniref:GRANULINS domain-containing protein n=1 Tax=Trichonephila inaurata madagascariensis TaxID=2747483 RepID=A0A8X6XWM4_9ARAC|nr:GRANULINS domain-containing protein [Trichonephila inaurata madagascariensis]
MALIAVVLFVGLTSVYSQHISPNALLSTLERKVDTTQPENTVMGQKLKDLSIEICPDKVHLCPVTTAPCCKNEDGKFDCCPKAASVAYTQGECCNHFGFVWTCCSPSVPKCHWYGCWWA